jgi:hypothetical protein
MHTPPINDIGSFAPGLRIVGPEYVGTTRGNKYLSQNKPILPGICGSGQRSPFVHLNKSIAITETKSA